MDHEKVEPVETINSTTDEILDDRKLAAEKLEDSIPDGGWRAWLIVLGAFCGMTITFGVSNGTGAIEDYLLRERLKDCSQSEVGWIFSLWLFIMYLGSVQTGPIFDAYGVRVLIVPGCICWVASLFILSVCKEYYQFILGFSLLGGISTSMIFNPSITVLGHWFKRKRALATGIAVTGGSIGGIFVPLMLQNLFDKIGYGWTIRVLAFIILGLSIVCCITLESRQPPRKVDWREALIDVRCLKNKDFAACTFGIFLLEWGFFIPIIYMVTYARAQGMTPEYATAVIAYLNIGSTIGRALPGYAADHLGSFNVTAVTSGVTGILMLALWIPAGHTKAGLTTFAVLFGFWSGSIIGVTPICVANITPTGEYGRRYGTAYSFASIAALTGLPIAGALTDHNFLGMQIFSGVCFVVGALVFVLSKYFAVGWRLIF